MAFKYTEEQLNKLDKELLIHLFLGMQEQMEELTRQTQSLNDPERQIVLYEYQKTRNASHPRNFLKDYTGICVTDGYQVYHTLEKEREDLRIAGCWVHCRRRFYDALEVIPKTHQKESILHLFIKQIQAIYREEGKLAGLSSEERLAQRQLVVKPLVDAFFAYLKQNETKVPKSGKTKEAFTYALNQERYLRVFLDDGDVPIDNNASERAIRGFCIGKKNWEMIDTDQWSNKFSNHLQYRRNSKSE